MIETWYIVKASRWPTVLASYSGPTWDRIEARFYCSEDGYDSRYVAEQWAKKLSEANPVGFRVYSREEMLKMLWSDK